MFFSTMFSIFIDQGNISQPDFEPEDIHELIESLVIKKTGIENGGKMHTSGVEDRKSVV